MLFSEGAAFLSYRLLTGHWFIPGEVRQLQLAIGNGENPWGRENDDQARNFGYYQNVLHPYLGWVVAPGQKEKEHGFANFPLIPQRNAHTVVVGVFGGSVAENIWMFGGEELKRELRQIPAFSVKEIMIVPFTLGGFKQPQQLLLLNYLLSLGATFDIVLVIDGFNEIALPTRGASSPHPSFPVQWEKIVMVGRGEDPGAMGMVWLLTNYRRNVAMVLTKAPLRFSATAGYVWRAIDMMLEHTMQRVRSRPVAFPQEFHAPTAYETLGPPYVDRGTGALLMDLVDLWKRSSATMRHVAEGGGSWYIHVLQPNQYDIGSKILSARERNIAFDGTLPIAAAVRDGYPLLRSAGGELRKGGEHFHDFSRIFKDVSQPLYVDACCHFYPKGAKIFATAIGKAIQRDLAGE